MKGRSALWVHPAFIFFIRKSGKKFVSNPVLRFNGEKHGELLFSKSKDVAIFEAPTTIVGSANPTTSAFIIVVYWAAPRDLDGTLGLRGDCLRDRSQQRSLRPPVTVRADYDQVRAPTLGLLDDGVFGRIYYDRRADRQNPNVAVAKPCYRALDNCLRPPSRRSLNVFAVARRQRQYLQRQGLSHGNDSRRAVRGPGSLRHFLNSDVAAFRTVYCYQDFHCFTSVTISPAPRD